MASVASAQSASDWKAGIPDLASLDYATRMNAARYIRRAPASEAVAALTEAARSYPDQFVRYRALVLLTAFNDRSTSGLMIGFLDDRNDRVREVAYKWLAQNPLPELLDRLLAALQTEQAEFVRPALINALAVLDANPQVQRTLVAESMRGLDLFRSAVIDALGHRRAQYALDAVIAITMLDGPLREDAILALGRIGGPKAVTRLRDIAADPGESRDNVRAALCLAGDSCAEHIKALADSALLGGSASNARSAASALSAMAASGNEAAITALVNLGARAGVVRDSAAFGLGEAAVRRPEPMLAWLERAPEDMRATAVEMLREGFERLEEDFAEEQFFAVTRASYWKAADGSASRTLAATIIQRLEF